MTEGCRRYGSDESLGIMMFTVIRISVEQEAMVQNIVHHLKPQKSVILRGIGVDEPV